VPDTEYQSKKRSNRCHTNG